MKKKVLGIILFLAVIGSILLTETVACEEVIKSENFRVIIEKGEIWTHKLKIMPFISINTKPQIAAWVTDTEGNYLETLYITQKNTKLDRPEALPYWSYSSQKSLENFALISSATPKGSVELEGHFKGDQHVFNIFAELNLSYDHNEYFPKKAEKNDGNFSGVSGQPSLIYKCTVDTSASDDYYEFQLIGHGSPDGSDGRLYEDLSTLTSALEMVKKISLIIDDL
ncbi:MAG: hypothetical protein PHR06_10355 [Candidatus Cloacimonetes bacterium]|nr:hypothetical protein [Candidatus Cloacimonadota bacterium]